MSIAGEDDLPKTEEGRCVVEGGRVTVLLHGLAEGQTKPVANDNVTDTITLG